MPGELRGKVVIIKDEREANRVHNKGYPGVPLSGGSLKLGLLEAAFLMDEKGFEIDGIESLVELFHHAGTFIPDFEVRYLVYRVLKLRGFFIRIPDDHLSEESETGINEVRGLPDSKMSPAPFRLLPRGSRPSVGASLHVMPISERDEFSLDRLVSFSGDCIERGVEGLLGVVDEDGDVTFYSLKTVSPTGDCQLATTSMVRGRLGQNRVLVPMGSDASLLQKGGFFGQRMGTILHLSLIEAMFLNEKGWLDIKGISQDELHSRASEEQPDIDLRYLVYRRLREQGIRVKTGFKYGTHFRAYASDPDLSHADFLVHVYPDGEKVDWQEISRGIRVAHGVKKRILFTSPGMVKENRLLELAWVRP